MVFSGTVESDFMKLAVMPETLKREFVNFASTDFTSLRQSMIDYIKAVYPNDYQNFNEADLGMMLVELMAYLGSVMSQKADMLAHENFLATAKMERKKFRSGMRDLKCQESKLTKFTKN